MIIKMIVTMKIAEEDDFSRQKVYEESLPTKESREAMENAENNPVALVWRKSEWG